MEKGVVVTIANGNDGLYGAFTESSGSCGEFVLAVASVNTNAEASANFTATIKKGSHSNTLDISYSASVFWDTSPYQGWPILAYDLDPSSPNDACQEYPPPTNLTGATALVSGENCGWGSKRNDLDGLAPTYTTPMLIYSDDPAVSSYFNGSGDYTVGYISNAAGAAILSALRSGAKVTATFPNPDASVSFTPSPEYFGPRLPSWYTSIGPTNDLNLKPDIAAPGGDIYSTWLDDGWAILSGTSMATPYIAGVAALYIGKYGGRKVHGPGFAQDLSMRIIASGKSMNWLTGPLDSTNDGFLAPVFQVGTGLVNASKVLDYQTSLSFSKFVLNDTAHFERYHSVDITNNGPAPVTYTFSLEAGGAIDAYIPNPHPNNSMVANQYYFGYFNNPYAAMPSVSFPGGTFTVPPGQTKTANINFMYPSNMSDASLIPLYGGKVIISGNNGESLAVPYMGVGADVHRDLAGPFFRQPGSPNVAAIPSIVSGPRAIDITRHANFTFNTAYFVQDYPKLYVIINYPTEEFRWDFFKPTWTERDWTYPPVVGQKGYLGSASLYLDVLPELTPPDFNDVAATPFYEIPRYESLVDITPWCWFGRLANGSQIALGSYQMRIAALRPFSTNPQSSDNWDIYTTPEITILPGPTQSD